MSSESSESDIFFSLEDIDSTEFSTCSEDFSDSGSNSDGTVSGRQSVKENEIEDGEVTEVVTTSLNTNEEKQPEIDIERKTFEEISPKDLNGPRKTSKDKQTNSLTRKTSSIEGPSITSCTGLDSSGRPSSRMASSLDFPNEPSIRRLSSLDPLEGPSFRMDSYLHSFHGPSSGSLSSGDSLAGPSSRIDSFLDPLEESSTRGVSSMNPLEGPSTQTVWISDPIEDSSTSICKSLLSEEATRETSDSVPLNASISRTVALFLSRVTKRIRRSKCYLLFNMALLALPFSAAYMGSRYQELCDGCPRLPLNIKVLGCLGTAMLTFQIASILSKYHFIPSMVCRNLYILLICTFLPFIPFLMEGISIIGFCDPDFTPSKANKQFCYKVFYDYVYYLNITTPIAIVLLFLIHVPGWFDLDDEEQ